MFNYSNNQENTPYSKYNTNGGVVDFDALQKARQDLISEIDAILEYDAHLHTTTNELAKLTWKDIKDEELVHVGELLALLNYLDPSQKQFVDKGFAEFTERMK